MNRWIEEAEKCQKEKDVTFNKGSREESIIIKENHEKISVFITKLNELIERVSKISPEERKPSIEVGSTHLEDDLRYEFFGSAFQLKEKRVAFFFKKKRNYFYWRRFFITVTDTTGLIKITIHEKGTSQTNQNDVVKQKMKILSNTDAFNEATCYHIIDWLVFRISSKNLIRNIAHLHQ